MQTFRVVPITPGAAEALRAQGGPVYVADESPGYPCRQCLQDADIGEELILVSHDPFTRDSPYRSASPIFLHLSTCAVDASTTGLPTQLIGRQLSVRAFDTDEMMIDAAVINGIELHDTLDRFFAEAETDRIHIRNATRGCWAAIAERV